MIPVLCGVKRSADGDVAVCGQHDDQPDVARLRGRRQRPDVRLQGTTRGRSLPSTPGLSSYSVRLQVRPGTADDRRQPVGDLVDRLERSWAVS